MAVSSILSAAIATVVVLFASSAATAQTVQLPEYRVFGVNTTVSVPDRGSALLGGIGTARSGSVSRGVPFGSAIPGPLFRSRGIGREVGSSTARVTAWIHDFEAMEEDLAAEYRRRLALRPSVGDGVRRIAGADNPAATAMSRTVTAGSAAVVGAPRSPTPAAPATPAARPATATAALDRFDALLQATERP